MPNITTPPPLTDPVWLSKLGSIIVQQDDEAEGTIIASALAAKRFLRSQGLRWRDVLPFLLRIDTGERRSSPASWQVKVNECLSRTALLNEKELDFLANARTFPRLSPRQSAWLDAIYERVRAA